MAKHLKYCIIFLYLSLLAITSAEGKIVDTTIHNKTDIREYKDELGYFQKANRDIGDPRFMFADEAGKYEFGIGGKLTISEFVGFNGSMNDANLKFFSTNIAIPTDYTTRFATKAACSVNFKARAKVGKYKVLAFLQLNGHSAKDVSINQAYVSLGGFSFGMIPSFFMDLEVGPMVSSLGPDCPVDVNHTLLGYTHRFKNGLQLALAMENADLDLSNYEGNYMLRSNFQPMPDIVGHIKYRWSKGHVQFGMLYRNLTYWAVDKDTKYSYQGWNGHAPGFGVSLSTNIKPTERLKLSGQFVYGTGIAYYLPNLKGLGVDLGVSDKMHGKYNMMKPVPVFDGLVALQYNWSKNWSSSFLAGYSKVFEAEGVQTISTFDKSHYFIGNLFYYIGDFAYTGVEYIYGNKSLYSEEPVHPLERTNIDYLYGHASRLCLCVVFLF